jgi:protein-disulfide isomerase
MTQTTWESVLVAPVDPERDHIRGPVTAPVTLVEYADFQCPFCAAAALTVDQVQALLGDELRFVYRHFPLTTVHPWAEPAAVAAEAAGSQGEFWPMHDLLFANQRILSTELFLAGAEELGLDVERFAKELSERVHAPRVREDFLSGVRSGVNGTPTFYVNGIRHNGPADVEALLGTIRAVT